jgi:hypothetical protein
MSLAVKSKTADTVKCEVVDNGELKSRRHLNVRGKSATLPSITGLYHPCNWFSCHSIASRILMWFCLNREGLGRY